MTQSTKLPTAAELPWNPLTNTKSVSCTSIYGSWTLSSMADEGDVLYMNADFLYNFKLDGSFTVIKIYGEQMTVSSGVAVFKEQNNTVSLIVDGEQLNFELIKITSLEMILKHNSGLEYYFLRNA